MKALKEIGIKKAFRFCFGTLVYMGFRLVPLPQLRVIYLRIVGAKIGRDCTIHSVKFFNYYRVGFSALKMGKECFLGNDVLLDLAAPITLGDQVTLAEKATIITHLNVGFKDHPLQKKFPTQTNPVKIESGCFVGVNAVILDGVNIGAKSFIAASSLVKDSVPAHSLVGGVPAKVLKDLKS